MLLLKSQRLEMFVDRGLLAIVLNAFSKIVILQNSRLIADAKISFINSRIIGNVTNLLGVRRSGTWLLSTGPETPK